MKDIVFLKYAGFFAVIQGVLTILSGALSQMEVSFYYIIDGLVYLNIVIIFFFAYIYFEGFLGVYPLLKRFMLIFGISVLLCTIIIYNTFVFSSTQGLTFLISIYGSVICVFGLYVIKKSMKSKSNKALKVDMMAIFLVLMGLSVFELVSILFFFTELTIESPELIILYFLGLILALVALCVFTINSYKNTEAIHFMPTEIHALLLYNKAGLLVYHHTFNPENHIFKLAEQLVSGALMGFSTFFKESFGTKAKLSYINASAFDFLFSNVKNELGTFVIISSKANYYVKKSLERLTKVLPKSILDKINQPTKTLYSDAELIKLVKNIFSYLDF